VRVKNRKSQSQSQSDLRVASIVSLSDVSVAYRRGQIALNSLSLEIPREQCLVIAGPSGSGKTTLLRSISGKIVPQLGEVVVRGRTATIHQDLRLVTQHSALSNVMHGALGRQHLFKGLLWFPRSERERAEELLIRVGLGKCLHQPVENLSGGEKQRVAIARALMQDPDILLADEPVAALDDVNAHMIMRLLRDIAQERKLTLITVLHDTELARIYGDRVLTLAEGEVSNDRDVSRSESIRELPEETTRVKLQAAKELTLPAAPPSALQYAAWLAGAAIIYWWCISGLSISGREMDNVFGGLLSFLGELLPRTKEEFVAIPWATLWASLLETIQMAIIGTTLGTIIAWPLSALAADNTGPRLLRKPVRFFLNVTRTVPSLIWALLFVAAVGLGAVAGILALVAHSVGYLSKFFYESFEGVEPGPPEALREIGANGLQRFRHAVWPAARPAVLSSTLFMLEYNVRSASILGVVDAGGIGFYLKQYIDFRFFPAVTAGLLMILVVVLAIDWVSNRVRARLVAEDS